MTVVLALLGGVGVPGVVLEAVNGVTEEVGWDEAAMACRNSRGNRHIRKVLWCVTKWRTIRGVGWSNGSHLRKECVALPF